MVVLPKEEYLELKQQQQQQHQPSLSLTPDEKKYEKVMHQFREHSNIKDPIEQQLKQGEDIHELRRLREKMDSYYFKNDKERGSQLLSLLSPSLIEFNHAGEIVDKRTKQTIKDSRIDDLINYSVSEHHHHHHHPPPHGWKEFINILKAKHIPHHSHTIQEISSSSLSSLSSSSSPPPPPMQPLLSPSSASSPSSPLPAKTKHRKSVTPAHLHRPKTRAKAKRSILANKAATVLLSSEFKPSASSSSSSTSFRKF